MASHRLQPLHIEIKRLGISNGIFEERERFETTTVQLESTWIGYMEDAEIRVMCKL